MVLPLNNKEKQVHSLKDLQLGAVVGTSSVRREALLKMLYPQLRVKLIRGNVQTRLKKLDEGEYDAIILAAAGLHRLKLRERISFYLNENEFPYGVGQGALVRESEAFFINTRN